MSRNFGDSVIQKFDSIKFEGEIMKFNQMIALILIKFHLDSGSSSYFWWNILKVFKTAKCQSTPNEMLCESDYEIASESRRLLW